MFGLDALAGLEQPHRGRLRSDHTAGASGPHVSHFASPDAIAELRTQVAGSTMTVHIDPQPHSAGRRGQVREAVIPS